MIQMRENRYNDIRKDVVNRSEEANVSEGSDSGLLNSIVKGDKKSNDLNAGPHANKADDYLNEEYNSWS